MFLSNNSPTPIPSSVDIAIIGGGIVGLWCADRALAAGAGVALFESGTIGQGASGGLLGALMPHHPLDWNEKKQFQLDGLLSLPGEIERLESETGVSCGYARVGRIAPLETARRRSMNEAWASAASAVWPAQDLQARPLNWTVEDINPCPSWLDEARMPHGLSFDSLSARASPRGLLAALQGRLLAANDAQLFENTPVEQVTADGHVVFGGGQRFTAGQVILAAGTATSSLVPSRLLQSFGSAVKGQAALLRPQRPVDPGLPILFCNGVYVIAHDDGLIAIGSTTETSFENATSTDAKLDDLIARATVLCPALAEALVVKRWAGLRPKAVTADPLVGAVPGAGRVIIATGGYKISFAIAHKMADAAVAVASGNSADVPAVMAVACQDERS
jgi:glycine oxidase